MDIKKLAPWNWFKKENEPPKNTVPVNRSHPSQHPLTAFYEDMDQLFDHFSRGLGFPRFSQGKQVLEGIGGDLLKPRLDLGATAKEYTVTLELPGISEKDITLELVQDSLIVRGEKTRETEEREKHYYRIERSYGAFQRILSLPEDAKREKIKARFKRGVLKITIPRLKPAESKVKQIEINYA